MLPYLYCQILTEFKYSSLYHLLKTLPDPHLKGWLRLILLKKVIFSKEEDHRAKPMMEEARKRLELFKWQDQAANHLIHLKKFFSEYPTVIQSDEKSKKINIGLRRVEKEKGQKLIQMDEEYKLTGQTEFDFLLAEQNLKRATSSLPTSQLPIAKHGVVLTDDYSNQVVV